MPDSMGQSAADHEGTDLEPDERDDEVVKPPITLTEDQLSVYIANTAHLVLYKLRKEMHREINKEVARLRVDHEKRWEQTRKQLRDYVRVEAVL